jgi:hypothetical protein
MGTKGGEVPMSEIFSHPELEKFLPTLPNWRFRGRLSPTEAAGGEGGLTYNKELGTWAGIHPLVEAYANNPNDLRSVILHEAGGHGAALDSSIPRGSNFGKERTILELKYPNMPPWELDARALENYNNNPGERAARTVENRRFLGPEDIRKTSPQFELSSQYQPSKYPAPENSWWSDKTVEEQKQHLIDKGMDPAKVEAAYTPPPPEPNIPQFTGLPAKVPYDPQSAQPSPLAQLLLQGLQQ